MQRQGGARLIQTSRNINTGPALTAGLFTARMVDGSHSKQLHPKKRSATPESLFEWRESGAHLAIAPVPTRFSNDYESSV